jgi:hypothetical protein
LVARHEPWIRRGSAGTGPLASGGLRRGDRDRGAEFTTVAARLLFGLLAQLAGEIGETVQCRIDADQGEIGLDDLQVKVPDVGEDAA